MLALVLINHIGIVLIMILVALIIGLIRLIFQYIEDGGKHVIISKSVKKEYKNIVVTPIIIALVIFSIFELFYWICKIFF